MQAYNVIESKDAPYVNVLVVRAGTVNSPAIKALAKTNQSPEGKAYLEKELLPKGHCPRFVAWLIKG